MPDIQYIKIPTEGRAYPHSKTQFFKIPRFSRFISHLLTLFSVVFREFGAKFGAIFWAKKS